MSQKSLYYKRLSLSAVILASVSLLTPPASAREAADTISPDTVSRESPLLLVGEPIASFTWTPETPTKGQEVQFNDTSSNTPTLWSWKFGDGGTSNQQNPKHTYASCGTFDVTLAVSNDYGYSSLLRKITIAGCVNTPAASFTFAPANPVRGEEVRFIDTSTGSPTSWSWSFGDASDIMPANTSQEKNPVNTFYACDSFTVSLTVSNSVGTSSTTRQVVVGGCPTVTTRTLRIPSLAHKPGTNNTNWRTNLALVNRSSENAVLNLKYKTGGTTKSANVSLEARHAVELRDVLVTLFDVDAWDASSGSLEIDAPLKVFASSRTYNDTPAGTYGQSFPALTEREGIVKGQVGVLLQLIENLSFRTNIGIQNLSAKPCTTNIHLFHKNGTELGVREIKAGSGEWVQENSPFLKVTKNPVDLGYAIIEVDTQACRIWAYGSVVDNATGDPTTVEMIAVNVPTTFPHTYLVPSVAHIPGDKGTQWRTDLGIVNLSGAKARLDMGFSGSFTPAGRQVFDLNQGVSTNLRDVLVTSFGLAGSSSGAIDIKTPAQILFTSRTYNQQPNGSYGQSFPAVLAGEGLNKGRVGLLPQLVSNPSFRTNIGVQNLSKVDCAVLVRLFGGHGEALGSLTAHAGPRLWTQLNKVFDSVGAGVQNAAYATLETASEECVYWAYASVSDNQTGDPTTVVVIDEQGDQTPMSKWQMSIRCLNQNMWMSGELYLPISGGAFDQNVAKTFGGSTAAVRIAGTYDAGWGTLTGTITVTFNDGSGDVRQDTLVATLSSGDSDWTEATMQSCTSSKPPGTCHGGTPCIMEIRLQAM